MNDNRVPAGVPTGGQFAASAHTESSVALSTALDSRPSPAWADDPDLRDALGCAFADLEPQEQDMCRDLLTDADGDYDEDLLAQFAKQPWSAEDVADQLCAHRDDQVTAEHRYAEDTGRSLWWVGRRPYGETLEYGEWFTEDDLGPEKRGPSLRDAMAVGRVIEGAYERTGHARASGHGWSRHVR